MLLLCGEDFFTIAERLLLHTNTKTRLDVLADVVALVKYIFA